jgi:hypothetical protein
MLINSFFGKVRGSKKWVSKTLFFEITHYCKMNFLGTTLGLLGIDLINLQEPSAPISNKALSCAINNGILVFLAFS